MIENLTSTTILGSRCYIYWMHTGGLDPNTGLPSFATTARANMLAALVNRHVHEGTRVIVVISGEATRKSGGVNQAEIAAEHFSKRAEFKPSSVVTLVTMPIPMMEAYRKLVHDYPGAEVVKFICEDAHMAHFKARMAMTEPEYAERVKGVAFDALTDPHYTEHFPLSDIIVRNFVTWMGLAWKRVGPFQMGLKMLDMLFNKPTRNPVKRGIIRVVTKLLREDLRG